MDSLPEKDIPTKAIVVQKPHAPFELRDVILDEVRAHEVLVQMKFTGICHTDLVVQDGDIPVGSYPAVLGHEGAGIIRRVGKDVQDLHVGDLALLSFASCMSCSVCKEGRKGSCAEFTYINFVGARGPESSPIRLPDGQRVRGQFFGQSSFSELAVVDARSVVKYSGEEKDLSFLAPLGCGYMTGAGTILNVLKPRTTSSVAVFGLGAVGLAAIMAAKMEGVQEIIAVDIVTWKLEMATKLGATHTIDPKQGDFLDAVHKRCPDGIEYIVDTTGSISMINNGIKALGHAGTLALVGVPKPTDQIEANAIDILSSCKRIIGVILGSTDPQEFLPRLLDMVQSGSFPVNLLSAVYPAKDVNQAIADMKAGKVIKPVLAW
ncbi:chaperonin 10-like protein [Exophiala viscosa]|uniref:chaperonin 10-like protein n=1 Tax=Exophiala viscosa TaxID=2486360 RepID=UPI0021A22C44|nr:chaperonin 10-like protein [Exophiala viscosa]